MDEMFVDKCWNEISDRENLKKPREKPTQTPVPCGVGNHIKAWSLLKGREPFLRERNDNYM